MASILIVGIGNTLRGDDGAGPATARRLRESLSADIRVLVKDSDFVSLLEDWRGVDTVVVIDATSSKSEPGFVRQYDAHERPLPAGFSRSSTHALGLAEVIELGRALGQLPARLIVIGIEGRDFTAGEALSPEVSEAIDETARRVIEAIEHRQSRPGP